jgi:hypothetical protein
VKVGSNRRLKPTLTAAFRPLMSSQVEVDRLLAEHGLARSGARGQQVDVGRRRRGDDHGVDVGVAEDRVGIPGGDRAVERGDLVRGNLDGIMHDGQLCPRVHGQGRGVNPADPSGAEQTETQHQALLVFAYPDASGR